MSEACWCDPGAVLKLAVILADTKNADSFRRLSNLMTYLLIFSVLSTVIIATIDNNTGQFMRWTGLHEDGCDNEDGCGNCINMTVVDMPQPMSNTSAAPPPKCLRSCQTKEDIKNVFDALTIMMPLLSSFLLAMIHK